ncbi:hypothetical protein ACF3M2_10595 [Tissierella carlieri]|uniref:hypothetical protein n=1 Tax=Tissierella carlieri TaxID=689904 RepID=UPI003868532B
MKRKICLLLIILLSISFNYTYASGDFSTYSEYNDNISEPKAPVRRIWYETIIFINGNSPEYYYYEYNGFRGYLSLGHQIGEDEYGGGYYFYSGYLYHPDYPFPVPTKLYDGDDLKDE